MSDLLTLTIGKLGARGDGLSEHLGKPVYVPMALPGEQVAVQVTEERKNGIYADLVEVQKPSSNRAIPVCEHFGKCGGCQMQHLDASLYENWVVERAEFALEQQGLSGVEMEEPFIAEPETRRRVSLKVLQTGSGPVMGFNAANSHQVVDLRQCPVMIPELWNLLPPLKKLLALLLSPRAVAKVQMTMTATGIDLLIDVAQEISLAQREACVDFANAHDLAAFHWLSEGFLDPIVVRREPVMEFAEIRVPLSPGSFIQATRSSEAAMVEHVLSACEQAGRIADLFCGLGTFTFPLAQHHQVLAVEGAQEALRGLEGGRNAAPSMGKKLKQIVTKHRDLFRRPLSVKELSGFEAVVIDPPRAGAQMQMEQLAKSDVNTIVSVSCNPNTFARDARLLVDGGYSFKSVKPIDQFVWSNHLELIGIFTRT